ncbi:MAG: hypothetical protein ACKVOM_05975 [Ferruginibacter sp.]
MKKILFIILVLFSVFIKNSYSQTTGVPDTLDYLQTIVANKSQYIGQPFSSLLNNLQIQIKLFQPFAAIHYDKNKETSTSFAFYFPSNADALYLTFPKLEIYWLPYLNKDLSNIIRQNNNNRGQWNSEAILLYSTGIIADIQIRE